MHTKRPPPLVIRSISPEPEYYNDDKKIAIVIVSIFVTMMSAMWYFQQDAKYCLKCLFL